MDFKINSIDVNEQEIVIKGEFIDAGKTLPVNGTVQVPYRTDFEGIKTEFLGELTRRKEEYEKFVAVGTNLNDQFLGKTIKI